MQHVCFAEKTGKKLNKAADLPSAAQLYIRMPPVDPHPERFFKQNNEIIINLICKYAKTLNPIIIDVACGTASKGSYVKCRLGKIGMRPFTIGIDPQAFPEQKTRLNYVINKNIENIQDILPVADFVVCQGLPLAESGYKIKTFKAVMKFLKPGASLFFK